MDSPTSRGRWRRCAHRRVGRDHGPRDRCGDLPIFVIALLRFPLRRFLPGPGERGLGLRPAIRFIRNDRAVFATTVMFMFANIGEGMMVVVIPVYARQGGGGRRRYGLLLSAFALATTAGARWSEG